jgi:3-deoxy-D-manno-octulosonate 8-phosphate phosphatase (KDO 8-P phosphatase)
MINEKASKIKLLLLDVDGVMTDGRFTINDRGEETKAFNVKDGLGLKMLMSSGLEVVIVTGRRSQALAHRSRELGIEEVYQGVKDKNTVCQQLKKAKGLKKEQVCSLGDDIPDLAMFTESGLSIAVADAVKEVREAADFITKSNGGFGAVREACELILKCQGKWRDALAAFTGQ